VLRCSGSPARTKESPSLLTHCAIFSIKAASPLSWMTAPPQSPFFEDTGTSRLPACSSQMFTCSPPPPGDHGDPPSLVRCVRGSIPLLITAPHGGSDQGEQALISCLIRHPLFTRTPLPPVSSPGKLGDVQVQRSLHRTFSAPCFFHGKFIIIAMQARLFLERTPPSGSPPPFPPSPPPPFHSYARPTGPLLQIFLGDLHFTLRNILSQSPQVPDSGSSLLAQVRLMAALFN
jgi:hypothetical protein